MKNKFDSRIKELRKKSKENLLKLFSYYSEIHSLTSKDSKIDIMYAILEEENLLINN